MFEGSTAPEHAKTAHQQRMSGFRQIRPIHKKVLPSINAAMQGEVNDNPNATPKDLRSARRAAFRSAAPLQEKLEKTEEERIREERLRHAAEQLSTRDSLTGLGNRRFFDNAVEIISHQAIRNGTQFVVILLDINGLKGINDGPGGHPAGDIKLQAISNTLVKTLRESDIVTRWGGDEFEILLPDTDNDGAIIACLKLQGALQTENSMTGSFGITVSDGNYTAGDLFREVDRTMYESKRRKSIAGDPCITTYDRDTDKYIPYVP